MNLLAQQVLVQKLTENWRFKQTTSTEWLPADVPGCVHTDLIDNHRIDDPFYRVNEKEIQWIGEKDWVYQSEFDVSNEILQKKNVNMVFKGLDTYADVYLNDRLILKADNMHRGWEVDVKKHLRPGQNSLRINFKSVFKVDLPKYLSAPFKLQAWPNNDQNSEIWLSLYARKGGFHYGWDWGPRLITFGIWRPIQIEAWDDFRLNDIQLKQNNVTEKLAKLTAIFEVDADKPQMAKLSISNGDISTVSKKVNLKEGINYIPIDFQVKKPKLWWTNGLGEPNMYAFKCKVDVTGKSDEKTINTGIRSLEIITEEDKLGKSLYVKLNGVPVFMKGANYIPLHNFQDRVTLENYEYYIQSAVEANMNMLRVWGGGIYEEDLFYDLCDKNGLLVWQDIMFACGMFPADPQYLASVSEEVKYNVKRLRNHPSIALWCGNNENEISWFGWGWKDKYDEETQGVYESNLKQLFYETIPEAIGEFDNRYYHATSPNTGYNDIPANFGDVHLWDTKGKTPLTIYDELIGRFMSEYGFQSYPAMQSIEKFTKPKDRNKSSEVMFAHNRARQDQTRDPNFGNQAIERKMETYYGVPDNFETYVYRTQILQAKASKIAIESHRRNMPYCMGTIFWQLNDCWPAVSWSTIDYYGQWKAAHYTVRDVYKSVITPIIIEDEKLRVYVVSDELSKIAANARFRITDLSGKVLYENEKPIIILSNTSKVYFEESVDNLLKELDKREVIFTVELSKGKEILATNIFNFVSEKELKLSDAEINVSSRATKAGIEITLTSDVFAKNVFLSFTDLEGNFSNNYFDLLPNTPKTIMFKSEDEPNVNNLSIKSYVDFK
ncbi:MAG: glycoside hydrolase family 2 protein [Bacteroidetes bacterium]|nr:glycoside hydrolase family 2 protein [Bacteroidota bacterium]